METNGKPINGDAHAVLKLTDGLGGVTVTFFDHRDQPGAEQRVGSITFPNKANASGNGEFSYPPQRMAEAIWNVEWALVGAPLTQSGSCFAFSRENQTTPTECPKDKRGEDPYLPILLAYDDLIESSFDDHGSILTTAPFPNSVPTSLWPKRITDRRPHRT